MSRDDDDDTALDGALEGRDPPRLLARDDDGGAPARRLLAALPNGDLPPAAKARVRRALDRDALPRNARGFRVAPVVALLLLATTAAIASGGGLGKLRLALVAGGEEASPARTHEPSARARSDVASPREGASAPAAADLPEAVEPVPSAEEPEPAPAPAPEPSAVSLAAPAAPTPPRAPARPAPAPAVAVAAPSAPAVEVSQGAALVLEAMRAVRKDHDPARASRVLADYRAHHAGGPLDEEALALAIEAGVATNDPGLAALARAYLARYPAGRFVTSAEAALARTASKNDDGAKKSTPE